MSPPHPQQTEMSLGGHYTTESLHHMSSTSGVNGTQMTAPGAQESHEPKTTCSSTASVTAFWNRLAKILHELLGPHPLHKEPILYGCFTLDTTPQQLANYLLVLAKPPSLRCISQRRAPTATHQTTSACSA
jgi:hypothetical protein